MRIEDRSSFRDANGQIPFSARLEGVLSHGWGWQAEVQAQDEICRRLGKVLGDDFVMLRTCPLPTSADPISLILVGPAGVRVMGTTALRGTYRAKGDQWMVLSSSGGFKPARPNLAGRVRLQGDAVRRYLTAKGFTVPDMEPVLIVARPETYVENIKSPLRVVLSDGVENYATGLTQLRPIFSASVVEDVARALLNPRAEAEAVAPAPASPEVTGAAEAVPRPKPRGRLTRRQWLLLGLMVIANLCVISLLVAVVLSNTLSAQ